MIRRVVAGLAALALVGCGSGLPGLNGQSSGSGGTSQAQLIAIYYGDNTSSSWSDTVDLAATGYANITGGAWNGAPTQDVTADVGRLSVGGNATGTPILYTSASASHFMRVDFVFDMGSGWSSGTQDQTYYQLTAEGGCSAQSTGIELSSPGLSAAGSWGVAVWSEADSGHWAVNTPSSGSLQAITTSNGTPFVSEQVVLRLNGLGGSGNYLLLSVRVTDPSCGSLNGLIFQNAQVWYQ